MNVVVDIKQGAGIELKYMNIFSNKVPVEPNNIFYKGKKIYGVAYNSREVAVEDVKNITSLE